MHCSLDEFEVGDMYHRIMRCPTWRKSRVQLIGKVNCLIDVPNLSIMR